MSWREYYNSRLMSAQEAAKIVKSGDCFWTPLLLGQPSMLIMDAIADRKDELKDVEYINCLTLGPIRSSSPSTGMPSSWSAASTAHHICRNSPSPNGPISYPSRVPTRR